jgi:hypothetical protein
VQQYIAMMAAPFSRQSTSKIPSLPQKTDANTLLDGFCLEHLWMCKTTVSILWAVLWSLDHTWITVTRQDKNPTGSHQNWSKMACEAGWPTLSCDTVRASAIFFNGHSFIIQEHGMIGIHVSCKCHLSWSPKAFISVLKCPVLNVTNQFLTVE